MLWFINIPIQKTIIIIISSVMMSMMMVVYFLAHFSPFSISIIIDEEVVVVSWLLPQPKYAAAVFQRQTTTFPLLWWWWKWCGVGFRRSAASSSFQTRKLYSILFHFIVFAPHNFWRPFIRGWRRAFNKLHQNFFYPFFNLPPVPLIHCIIMAAALNMDPLISSARSLNQFQKLSEILSLFSFPPLCSLSLNACVPIQKSYDPLFFIFSFQICKMQAKKWKIFLFLFSVFLLSFFLCLFIYFFWRKIVCSNFVCVLSTLLCLHRFEFFNG